MNYKTKNVRNALLTFIGLSVAFHFFFISVKFGTLLGIIISAFLSITMFFTPSKLEKAKKKSEQEENEKIKISAKEISDEEVDNLDLNNIDGFDFDEEKKDAN